VLLVLTGCRGSGTPSQSVAEMFRNIMPPSPSEVARDAWDIYDADKRRRSIGLLSTADWGGEDTYLEFYRLLVTDTDPTVRAAALSALGRHGTGDDVVRVVPYLRSDKSKLVRWSAARALQRLQHPDAVAPLLSVLREDPEANVRMACANALGQYRQPKVFQGLIGAIKDENFAVVQESRISLNTLTGQDFGEDTGAWLRWSEDQQNLFADAGTYYYPQYERPPGVWDKMQFWKDRQPLLPAEPRGPEGDSASSES
jgi:hypothetical protein